MTALPAFERTVALECRVLTELSEWRKLEPFWDVLLEASPDRTPWQNFAFLTGWWQHLSENMPLRIFVVERGGIPCLIVPLQISKWERIPGLPVKLLEPVGMVMDVNRPRLGLGPFDPQSYRCAFDAIWNRQKDWDLFRIDEKPWDDPEVALLRDYALEKICIFRQIYSHLVPYLDLRQDWQRFMQGRSQKMRKNIKAAHRKLAAMGSVELRRYVSPAEVKEGFRIFLDLHTRSWKKKRKVEYSRSPDYQTFFAQWIEAMAQHGACSILILYCGEEAAAATLAFTNTDTYYSAQIVHDAKFAACSPGTLLESMELEALMKEQRFARYEFLGSFLNNKMRWTDNATNTAMAMVFRRSFRCFVMDMFYSCLKPYARPAIVALIQKFRPAKPNAAQHS